jgi:UDP-N-acetylmuramate dehydrogenase
VFILGAGSNIVLPRQLDALVLQLAIQGVAVQDDGRTVEVAAGEDWHGLVADMLTRGLHGLENLALIPGTVGAAPVQNIGAYGVELEQLIVSVRALDTETGQWLQLSRQECEFSYRDSLFRSRLQRYVISRVRLRLSRSTRVNTRYAALRQELDAQGIGEASPQQVFNAVVAIRKRKLPDPGLRPNAGSFFKNPVISAAHYGQLLQRYPGMVGYPQGDGSVKLAAAWLIERAGFKGVSRAGVGMHEQQALVLINRGQADAGQVLDYAREVVSGVQSLFNVSLHIEPLLVQGDGSCLTA